MSGRSIRLALMLRRTLGSMSRVKCAIRMNRGMSHVSSEIRNAAGRRNRPAGGPGLAPRRASLDKDEPEELVH
eukprot:1840350-Heterocapsa_arctica.AAC.1